MAPALPARWIAAQRDGQPDDRGGRAARLLIARRTGASSAAIGGAFAVIGAGGVLSAMVTGPLRRRLSARWAVLAEPWFYALLMPLLLVQYAGETAAVIGLSAWALAVAGARHRHPRLSQHP